MIRKASDNSNSNGNGIIMAHILQKYQAQKITFAPMIMVRIQNNLLEQIFYFYDFADLFVELEIRPMDIQFKCK